LIFLLISIFILLLIAAFVRYIDIDRLIRIYDPPLRVTRITQSGFPSHFYQIDSGTCILPDWLFRVDSIKYPQLHMQTNWRPDGVLSLIDKQGREFLIGKAVTNPVDEVGDDRTVTIDPGDQAVFQVSRSLIPYYYGWYILSPAPLFRHFRYYKLFIRQASGATLQVKWKFTTYRASDGSWVPDQLGLRGEGLVDIRMK